MNKAHPSGHSDHDHELAGDSSAMAGHATATRLQQLESALEDLQSRFLFQEDTLLQLDDALVTQQNTIDRLEKLLADFADKVDQQLHDRQGGSPEHEKPPHY
ncbi:SlyX family protein [Allohahella marinimesophila]